MSKRLTDGISRRGFLVAVAATGAAATASVSAAPTAARPAPSAPGPARPVRALHEGVPYFDFSGRAIEAKAQKVRPQKPLSALTAEEQYLMGAW